MRSKNIVKDILKADSENEFAKKVSGDEEMNDEGSAKIKVE